MKKVKELIKEQENKSVFLLAWSIMWRWFVIVLGFYVVMFFFAMLFGVALLI